MDADSAGNVYVANCQYRSEKNWGWDDVYTGDHQLFIEWYYSDLTIYPNHGAGTPKSYLNCGPWHNRVKGYTLPMAIDNQGNVYSATGMSRYNRLEEFQEQWPNAAHMNDRYWQRSDLTVYLKEDLENENGAVWYYIDHGPWFNSNTDYSLPFCAIGDLASTSFTPHYFILNGSPPSAPTNLPAMAVSSSQINLTWQDNSSDETGFEIEHSSDGNIFTHLVFVSADSTSYHHLELSHQQLIIIASDLIITTQNPHIQTQSQQ
ncbi:MAG: fibronectin type III domain-containing protein [Calditrichaeota bacterium]|nr:MAG: fibronectin type III domain-containing protein [Calditrichota bacterium]